MARLARLELARQGRREPKALQGLLAKRGLRELARQGPREPKALRA